MDKFWKEILKERLCEATKWLTKPAILTLKFEEFECTCRSSSSQMSDILKQVGVCCVLFAVPFKENVSTGRKVVFQQIKSNICWCRDCERYKFYCSPKYLPFFAQYYWSPADSFFIEAVTVLLDIFPLKLERVLVTLPVLYRKPMITKAPFQCLLRHVYTLEIYGSQYFSERSSSFLKGLLEGLVSNSSTLQYLYLNIDHSRSSYQKYGEVISTIAPYCSPMLKSQDVDPLLSLKVVKIAANFRMLKSVEIKELTAIINSQEDLETLEILAEDISAMNTYSLRNYHLQREIFQVMASCFQKPNFQCLILENLYVKTSVLLDVEYHFLRSTACRKQQLVLRNLRVHSFDIRKNITYASESTVHTKSLSVINCRIEGEIDIASGILLYPGIQELELRSEHHCPDPAATGILYKLIAALEKGTGTLQCLDLTGFDLSSIIVKASPLLDAIFHLPHLSELELVLKNCHLQEEHLDQLYCEWEKKSRGQTLRRLCVCGNMLPVDTSNLEMMAKTLH